MTISTGGLSPFARSLAEQIPTRPRPAPRPVPPPKPVAPWTRAEQDAHWVALCEAVGTPDAVRPHLRLVADGEAGSGPVSASEAS